MLASQFTRDAPRFPKSQRILIFASTFLRMHQTPTRRLTELIMDEPLEAFVSTRRDAGRSWRVIARDLWIATDGQIDVTAMTLQNWFAGDTKASA